MKQSQHNTHISTFQTPKLKSQQIEYLSTLLPKAYSFQIAHSLETQAYLGLRSKNKLIPYESKLVHYQKKSHIVPQYLLELHSFICQLKNDPYINFLQTQTDDIKAGIPYQSKTRQKHFDIYKLESQIYSGKYTNEDQCLKDLQNLFLNAYTSNKKQSSNYKAIQALQLKYIEWKLQKVKKNPLKHDHHAIRERNKQNQVHSQSAQIQKELFQFLKKMNEAFHIKNTAHRQHNYQHIKEGIHIPQSKRRKQDHFMSTNERKQLAHNIKLLQGEQLQRVLQILFQKRKIEEQCIQIQLDKIQVKLLRRAQKYINGSARFPTAQFLKKSSKRFKELQIQRFQTDHNKMKDITFQPTNFKLTEDQQKWKDEESEVKMIVQ